MVKKGMPRESESRKQVRGRRSDSTGFTIIVWMDLDGSAIQVVGGGVAWLVDRQIRAARELDRGEQTPALVAERGGDRDTPGGKVRQRLLDVVAHQVELVLPRPVSRVYGDLGRRQLEDQPATAGVDPSKSEHVADEDPVGLRVGAVENDMCSVDHVSRDLHVRK